MSGRCDRCRSKTMVTIMSMFNTQEICMKCNREEMQHPDYERACQAEAEAVRQGNYNFPGIGWPR